VKTFDVGMLIEKRYRVLSVLGRGGMGILYLVQDEMLAKSVALKMLNFDVEWTGKQALIKRFQSEFKLLAQLHHPNLVRVYDYGITADGNLYFTMEWLQGQDLKNMLGKAQQVNLISVIVQICRALAYLHARNVIHGDLKPANVLLVDDQVKLVDFGVALDLTIPDLRAQFYAPGYTAPEVKEMRRIDHRVDLYSLGALFYALVVGEPPLLMPGAGRERLIQFLLAETVEQQGVISAGVERIIAQLLSEWPGDRYDSANQVIEALNEVADKSYALETKETAGSYALRSRFVGRKEELDRLHRSWQETLPGKSLLTLIAGESGVGKTRLLEELAVQVQLDGGRIAFGQCEERGGSAYNPWRTILRLLVPHVESVDRKLMERLGPVLAILLPELWQRVYVSQVGVPSALEPEAAQRRLNRVIVRLLHSAARLRPTLVVIEDAHWADEATLELLQFLTRIKPQTALYMCVTYRPNEVGAGHPLSRLKNSEIPHLTLKGFPLETTGDLLCSMLGVEELPEHFVDQVQSSTAGNVFFVRELVRAWAEDGRVLQRTRTGWRIDEQKFGEVGLSESIHQVILRRLERLSPDSRRLLQQAAVVGSVFWDGLLETLLPASQLGIQIALSEALGKELVYEQETSAFAGEREYRFVGQMVRDVNYDSIALKERQLLHKRIAAWLLDRPAKEVQEHLGLIADHLESGGLEKKAIVYLRKAGYQAMNQFAHSKALQYLSRALDLTPVSNYLERYELVLTREKINGLQGRREEQAHDLKVLKELADLLKDDELRVKVALRRAHYGQLMGDFSEAILAAQRAINLAQSTGQVDSQALGYLYWGQVLCRQGAYEAAEIRLEEAWELARNAAIRQTEADSLRNLGIVSYYLGDYTRAGMYYERALHIHREIGDQQGSGHALNNLGIISFYQGDYGEARSFYEQALDIRQQIGDMRGESEAYNNLGSVYSELGDYERARIFFEKALRLHREIGDRQNEALMLVNLSLLFHKLDENRLAQKYSEQALHIAQEVGDRSTEAYAWTFLGHALAALASPHDLVQALEAYQGALDLRRELNQSNLATEPLAGSARVYLAQHNFELAKVQVEEILRFTESNTLEGTEEPFRVLWTCYRVLEAVQDSRAEDVLQRAYRWLQERADQIQNEALRRSFLQNVAVHRSIVKKSESTNVPPVTR
jgi:predicted ATPase